MSSVSHEYDNDGNNGDVDHDDGNEGGVDHNDVDHDDGEHNTCCSWERVCELQDPP